ncbi:MAG TPA: HAD family hydrolase [Actinomycetota bacterium]
MPTIGASVDAVTFDFWDTLVAMEGTSTMRDQQIDGFAQALGTHGHSYERDRLVEVFASNWTRFEDAWEDNTGQYTPTDATDFIVGELGVPVTAELRADLIDAFRIVGESAVLEAAPGIAGCLSALHQAGIRLGIVCDVGLTSSPTLRDRLEGFGLLRWFQAWSFSDETGWFKPAAGAFMPTLDGLGVVDASRAAHVGDNPRTDVSGARALGMTTIRYTGFRDVQAPELPDADHVIGDHERIPGLLGIA